MIGFPLLLAVAAIGSQFSAAVADNAGAGVMVSSTTTGTQVSRNSIYGNGGLGIHLVDGGNTELPAPVVWAYDTAVGTASGIRMPSPKKTLAKSTRPARWQAIAQALLEPAGGGEATGESASDEESR